jgi:Tfp pilus assembly protein PilV
VNRNLTPAVRLSVHGCRLLLICCLLALGTSAKAQTSDSAQTPATYQRVYPRSVAEVRAAVQSAKSTARGRLPTLEGFVVEQATPSLDKYDKGFYECAFDVAPAVGGGTLVVATAKITAYLNDPTTGVSGYRVMTSNGRLENDALDRIEETLTPGLSAAAPPPSPAAAPPTPAPSNGGLRPSRNFNTGGPTYVEPVAGTASSGAGESSSRDSSSTPTTRAPRTPISPAAPLPTGESLAAMHAREAADQQKSRELSALIQSLEEMQKNQSRPANLAAVKKPKTPVYVKAAEGAPLLMTADAQDEFEVLETSGPWVHVRISGASRGWIRRAQLEMPPGYAQSVPSTETAAAASPAFKLSKEETNSFTGSWDKLKGKTVRVEWVEAQTSSPGEKLAYAKSIFLRAYQGLSTAHENVDGIVIVFDSADGGQIAAALPSVKSLADKTISEAAFWRECSLDPPESFQISGK